MVQKQLGHSSIKTTQVYADVFDEDLNQAVEKLYKRRKREHEPACRQAGKTNTANITHSLRSV
jgi:hypothetical protein